jgi:hypothetical protein
MTNQNDSALRERNKALKLAEIRDTDAEEFETCVSDMQKFASLNEAQARIVASAVRARTLPSLAREAGIDDAVIAQMAPPREHGAMPMKTDSFADDSHNDHMPEEGHDAPMDSDAEDIGGDMDGAMPHQGPKDFSDSDADMGADSDTVPSPHGDLGAMPMKDDTGSDDMSGAGPDDLSEDNDGADAPAGNIATIQIEVPEDKIDDSKMAEMQSFLEQLFGDGDDLADHAPTGDDALGGGPDDAQMGSDEDMGSDSAPSHGGGHKPPFGGGDKPPFGDDSNDAEDAEPGHPQTATRKVNTMNKEAAARATERRNVLASVSGTRTASEEGKPEDIGLGKDTSEGTYGGERSKPFQFADDAQYHGEGKFPTMTMQNSDGNSLRDQNPTFNKTRVPTLNPENLQLGDSYEVVKKDGTPDGSMDYSADFEKVDFIPATSEARDGAGEFQLPTQMEETARRKNTVASKNCEGCYNTRKASVDEFHCKDCSARVGKPIRVAICEDCFSQGYCPSCAATTQRTSQTEINIKADENEKCDEGKTDDGETERTKGRFDGTEMPQKDRDTNKGFDGKKEAEVFKARLRTAYSVSTRLAFAGILTADEVEENVETWMTGGLSAKTMLTQGGLWLKSATNATDRVVAAAAGRMNTRTASTNVGVSTNPAFSGSQGNSAPLDLALALKGVFDKSN